MDTVVSELALQLIKKDTFLKRIWKKLSLAVKCQSSCGINTQEFDDTIDKLQKIIEVVVIKILEEKEKEKKNTITEI